MTDGIGNNRTLFQSVVILGGGDFRHSLHSKILETSSLNTSARKGMVA
uniref:Uncharacterized protein MANES_05G025700 n=1 Tax=Rhizophora mucronata TaxID=61149 RepID=A0A2P2JBY1_RHIMU